MGAVSVIYAFVLAHYVGAAGVSLVAISTVSNRMFPDGKLPTWLALVVDLLALLAKPGQKGVIGPVSLPLVPSRKAPVTAGGIVAAKDVQP